MASATAPPQVDGKVSSTCLPTGEFEPADLEYLRKRGISPEFAAKSRVQRLHDNQVRRLNFQASLPLDQREQGLQGLYFPSIDPATGEERVGQLRTDYRFEIQGRPVKYLSRRGEPVRAYFPHTVTEEKLLDPKIDLIITESPAKALAISEAAEKHGDNLIAIGLNGVNCGWSRAKKEWRDQDGAKKQRSVGPARLIEDLKRIPCNGRDIYVVFDNDVGTKKQAQEYQKTKGWGGSIGAEEKLAALFRSMGASTRIVELPHSGVKLGADDFLVRYGWPALLRHIQTNWVTARDINRLLYEPRGKSWTMACSTEFMARKIEIPKEFVQPFIVLNQGVTLLSGPSKFGKSTAVLNLAHSLTTGEPFLKIHPTLKARVCYLQYEMADWSIQSRLRNMGAAHEDLWLINPEPGELKFNFLCEQGFKKNVETGNREEVYRLVRTLQDQSIGVLIIDALGDSLQGSEKDETAMKDYFAVCRLVARSVPCAVVLVHHNKKWTQGSEESPEEASGFNALTRAPDAILSCFARRRTDDTFRYKMLYTLRHGPAPEPIELLRDGGNSLRWRAVPWTDGSANLERPLQVLKKQGGPMSTDAVAKTLGKHRTTAMRHLKQLATQGLAAEVRPGWWVIEGVKDE